MFDYKTKFREKIKSYIVTTKETSVRGLKKFALCYEKTIIYKK